MAKMISGILARDGTHLGHIVFFRGLDITETYRLELKGRLWAKDDHYDCDKSWSPCHWKATYNLKPPPKGKYFEVEKEQ